MQDNKLPFETQSGTKLIAVVDDEPDIQELVIINLKKAGFKAKGFDDGNQFFSYLKEKTPDLVILDLMLPDADGMEICKYLKKDEKYAQIPVIMLTAKTDEMEKVLGLEIGADDYITKPFSTRELVARVKAVLRRGNPETISKKLMISDSLTIDLQKYETYVNDEIVNLTATEFKILKLLSKRIGWVYSREQILDYLGVNDKGVLDRTVDVHIKNLREKLGDAGNMIKNIRGIGYKIEN
jgi:two-component system phosphate regulon response regulator PhoB/two-component system alkaline phosphatase synthesis response regulator PhoP